jgi:hypothetical protein
VAFWKILASIRAWRAGITWLAGAGLHEQLMLSTWAFSLTYVPPPDPMRYEDPFTWIAPRPANLPAEHSKGKTGLGREEPLVRLTAAEERKWADLIRQLC